MLVIYGSLIIPHLQLQLFMNIIYSVEIIFSAGLLVQSHDSK